MPQFFWTVLSISLMAVTAWVTGIVVTGCSPMGSTALKSQYVQTDTSPRPQPQAKNDVSPASNEPTVIILSQSVYEENLEDLESLGDLTTYNGPTLDELKNSGSLLIKNLGGAPLNGQMLRVYFVANVESEGDLKDIANHVRASYDKDTLHVELLDTGLEDTDYLKKNLESVSVQALKLSGK